MGEDLQELCVDIINRASACHWTAESRQQNADMGFTDGWMACAQQIKALAEEA